jgi:hypothetical protein
MDVDVHYNQQKQQAELKFSCYLPADKGRDRQYAEPVKVFAYKVHEGDFDLANAIDVIGCVEGRKFEQFKSQLKGQLNYYAQTRLENEYPPKELVALMSKGKFWQCMEAKEDTKAPMAVWERDGKYAVRIVGEVNRERAAANKSSTDRSR